MAVLFNFFKFDLRNITRLYDPKFVLEYDPLEKYKFSWEISVKTVKNCRRSRTSKAMNFTEGRMTEVLTPDTYGIFLGHNMIFLTAFCFLL